MTKQQLNEYRHIRANIDEQEELLARVDAELTRITAVLSDMPKGYNCNNDKMTTLYIKKEAIINEINDRLLESYDKLDVIEDAIRYLPEREKLLMRLRYIEGMRWRDVLCILQKCERDKKNGITRRHMHRIHARVLRQIYNTTREKEMGYEKANS